jgi:hypothetical protein
MRIVVLCITLFLGIGPAMGQVMVEYDIDFRFRDGIFLSFDDFKFNNPVPITHIISNHDIRLPDYMELVTDEPSIRFFDNLGEERTVSSDRIWGYAHNGKAFIGHGDGFFRMPLMGTITHFTAIITTYRMMSDPMMMTHPGMMMPYHEVPVQEMRQFLLDMRSGKVFPYSVEVAIDLMASDPELSDELRKMNKRKRQQNVMMSIRRFNERYPLYFPE